MTGTSRTGENGAKEQALTGVIDSPRHFRAALNGIDTPDGMTVGQSARVEIHLRNEGTATWGGETPGSLPVRLGYHWLLPDGATYVREGVRTDLPRSLAPGESVRFFATIACPSEVGEYILQWDLVIEDVAWFSERGWHAPTVAVRAAAARPDPCADLDFAAIIDRVAPYSMVPYRWLVALAHQVRVVLREVSRVISWNAGCGAAAPHSSSPRC